MAEAIALAASIIAVVQLADRIASVCKSLIEIVEDYPRDLRLIFVETGSLKVIFESLHFLNEDDPADSATLRRLRGSNGPVEGCKTAMDELNQLFPTLPLPGSKRRGTKRQKLQNLLTSLAWPRKAEKARRLLDEIMRHKATINIALQGQLLTEFRNMKHELDEVHVTLNASEKRKVYEWFQDMNPSSSHNAAKGLYEDSTGDWVFKVPVWDDWINARIRALWVHGIPGAGKTVLAAHIIETTLRICEAKDKRTTCVYYYCYHGHNQDESVPFLRWLVSQILREADTVPILAWKAYTRNREPDTAILLDILHEVLDFFDLVYVAIDALDESQSRENLLSVLDVLVTDPRFWKIQLLATSREYSDIELKMGRFSQSLSMSNCFVEADIRTYIAAKITAESKFQRWPSDLRMEVEATLSAGAKGDVSLGGLSIGHLTAAKPSVKIREAIKNLPESLDETYKRVFSYIADEEKEFVRHILHWVCFHDFLWQGSVPLSAYILIDGYIALEKRKSVLSSDEYLFDLDTLKDSCGCLISFTLNKKDQSYSANIAHYTVREFLESNRSSFTSWFSIKQKDSYRLILAFIFEYAITSDPIEMPEDYDDPPLNLGSSSGLQEYCLATSVRSLRDVEELIEPRLAFRFLDPLEAHFEALKTAISLSEELECADILSPADGIIGFWHVNWHESTKSSRATTLANLLLMRCFGLAKDFIQVQDIESVLQEILFGEINETAYLVEKTSSGEVRFECGLIEFLAEICEFNEDVLSFFQREARGFVCYTDLLPRYMPGHTFEYPTTCKVTCVLERLLQLGANPDPKGFQVTPLQMAVFNRDLAGARMLLEAGADSNNTGDEQGIKQHAETSIFGSYYRLHGLAPLYILHHLEAHPHSIIFKSDEEIDYVNGALTTDLEHLLLEYNASTGIYGE